MAEGETWRAHRRRKIISTCCPNVRSSCKRACVERGTRGLPYLAERSTAGLRSDVVVC